MLEIGENFENRFKVIKIIPGAGMSNIYYGIDLNNNSEVIIKEVSKEEKRLFKNGIYIEKKIIEDLNHPRIPKLIDYVDKKDSIYMVIEYIHGQSLSEYIINNHPISEEKAIQIVKDITELFIYLHTRNVPIVYKDLKPENIIINEEDEIKLIDFGISTYLDGSKKYSFGTRGYAPPEQYLGDIDNRSDIYALGSLIISLLTGSSKVRIKGKDLKEVRPDVSNKLIEIIDKCQKTDKSDRYMNMSEVLKELISYRDKRKIPMYLIISIVALLIITFLLINLIYVRNISEVIIPRIT